MRQVSFAPLIAAIIGFMVITASVNETILHMMLQLGDLAEPLSSYMIVVLAVAVSFFTLLVVLAIVRRSYIGKCYLVYTRKSEAETIERAYMQFTETLRQLSLHGMDLQYTITKGKAVLCIRTRKYKMLRIFEKTVQSIAGIVEFLPFYEEGAEDGEKKIVCGLVFGDRDKLAEYMCRLLSANNSRILVIDWKNIIMTRLKDCNNIDIHVDVINLGEIISNSLRLRVLTHKLLISRTKTSLSLIVVVEPQEYYREIIGLARKVFKNTKIIVLATTPLDDIPQCKKTETLKSIYTISRNQMDPAVAQRQSARL